MGTNKKTPKLEESPNILVVEGHSDLLFYAAFLRSIKRLNGVFIKEFTGKSNILKREILELFLTKKLFSEKKNIGIILDADDNPTGTAQAIKDHLLALTGRTIEEGQWFDGEPRLGFLVVPDLSTVGEIETLTWTSLPGSDKKYVDSKAAIDEYMEKMNKIGWTPKSPDKARIGAFLSIANDEDPRLGPGAREGKFDFMASGFGRLRAFLEGLPISQQ